MRSSNASEEYIKDSLSKDLSSVEGTYLVHRGTFFVLERLEDGHIVGMVGLQDLSRAPRRPHSSGTATTTSRPRVGHESDVQSNNYGDEDGKNMCELRRMSVHSGERRKGRGAQLIERCIGHAKEQGFRGIQLSTGSWMTTAVEFYVSLGFEAKGIVQYYRDGKVYNIQQLEMLFDSSSS
jgi:GNAT superfamily N-acetyltransferase